MQFHAAYEILGEEWNNAADFLLDVKFPVLLRHLYIQIAISVEKLRTSFSSAMKAQPRSANEGWRKEIWCIKQITHGQTLLELVLL